MQRTFIATIISFAALIASASANDEQSQLAYFNHLVAFIDAETYRVIENSTPLKNVINFEKRTTTANNGESWTGQYLMGRETYVEFFQTYEMPSGFDGLTSVALSTERQGAIDVIENRLTQEHVAPDRRLRTRKFDGVEIDWYHRVRFPSNKAASFSVRVMEYVPDYFDHPAAKKEPAEGPSDLISRERYQSDAFQNFQIRDVAAIDLAVTPISFDDAETVFKAAGIEVSRPNETELIANGHDVLIRLIAAPSDKIGVRRIKFTLNAPVSAPREIEIGRSHLVIGPGNSAVWYFE